MNGDAVILNEITASRTVKSISSSGKIKTVIVKDDIKHISSRAVAGTIVASHSGKVILPSCEIIGPNDFVNSCFGAGSWIEDMPWGESDAWFE